MQKTIEWYFFFTHPDSNENLECAVICYRDKDNKFMVDTGKSMKGWFSCYLRGSGLFQVHTDLSTQCRLLKLSIAGILKTTALAHYAGAALQRPCLASWKRKYVYLMGGIERNVLIGDITSNICQRYSIAENQWVLMPYLTQ